MSAGPLSLFASGIEPGGAVVIDPSENPELCLYRERTLALLKKYMRLALDTGRMPSLLGKEIFRSKVSSYRMITFEDAVIFVHDVEGCLEQLDEWSKVLISRIVLEEYTHDDMAAMMGCSRRTIERDFPDAVDRLSHIFLSDGLLRPKDRRRQKVCQEGKNGEIRVSACDDGKNNCGKNVTIG